MSTAFNEWFLQEKIVSVMALYENYISRKINKIEDLLDLSVDSYFDDPSILNDYEIRSNVYKELGDIRKIQTRYIKEKAFRYKL